MSVEDVSDSAMFSITSRNDGTDPVVIAFKRGIVTVGELAWAVNGKAAPDRIKLLKYTKKGIRPNVGIILALLLTSE